MKRLSRVGVAVVTLALISSSSPQRVLAVPNIFSAHLRGGEVVPETQSHATGQAKFTLDAEGTVLQYRINVSNIENIVQASLHLGMPGENGEAVAILYGPEPAGGGKKTGIFTAGTITQANLVGSLSGRPLEDLISAMKEGRTYVVVSTNDGAGTVEKKPGDYPDGEIRGQVR